MRYFILLLCALTLTSCIKNNKKDPSPEDPVVTARLTTETAFVVPVKSDSTTVVTFGGDTLCITKEATSIWVPKTQLATKSEPEIVVSYIDDNDPITRNPFNQMWRTIAFEDSEEADYDYNDLVIHAIYQLKGRKFAIGIHPIALGSTKTIALGCKIYVNDVLFDNYVFSSNCRETLFSSQAGYINTQVNNPNFHTNLYKASYIVNDIGTSTATNISVVWYIQVANKMFYAVNDKCGYLTPDKRPYGLIITNTGKSYMQDGQVVGTNWFQFPYEWCSISNAYPTFDSWIDGTSEYCDFANPNTDYAIDIDTYLYDRPGKGLTRIYYFPMGRKVI